MTFLRYALVDILLNHRCTFPPSWGVLLAITFVSGTFIAIRRCEVDITEPSNVQMRSASACPQSFPNSLGNSYTITSLNNAGRRIWRKSCGNSR